MSEPYDSMDACLGRARARGAAAVPELLRHLAHPDWRVRYAAAVALGDLRAAAAVPALLAVLREEDAAPLYTQTGDLGGGACGSPQAAGPSDRVAELPLATVEAWRRRGRVKQAVCFALADIGAAAAPALPFLQRYAVDPGEDYGVRAAAGRALGRIDPAAARDTLAQAARDPEFCTRTEAAKSLARAGTRSAAKGEQNSAGSG